MAPSDLFKDLKFFVVQRVPTRQSLLAAIKDHGGIVVPLEKLADFLIADHARKDVPAGFISWTFITQSVKNGRLEDEDKHTIHVAKSAGPAATGTAKGTRAPFTKEDDDLLRVWVSRPASKEAGTSGNLIFKQLAELNPRHTWQSWRDRWVKKLAPFDAGAPSRREGTQGPEEPVTRNEVPSIMEPRSPVRHVTKGAGRVPFTQEDDDFLRSFISRPENGHLGSTGTKLFRELEAENSRHSWQSWRERWVKKLSRSAAPTPSTGVSSISRTVKSSPKPRPKEAPGKAQPEVKGQSPRSSPAPSPAAAKMPSPKPTKSNPQSKPSNTPLARADTHPETRSDSSENETDEDFPPVRNYKDPEVSKSSRPSSRHSSTASNASSESNARSQFYEHLQSYRAAIGKALVTSVTITRRAVDIWNLWSAVVDQGVDPELRDWEDVAKELGFDWVSNPTVTHQLKKAYDVHLREFERLREEYLQGRQELEEPSSDDAPEDAVSANRDPSQERVSTSPAFKSSPPVAGTKRAWDQTFDPGFRSSIAFVESPNKRREYSRGDIVPESPQGSVDNGPLSTKNTPLGSREQRHLEPELKPSEPQPALPSMPARAARAVEPETQDFGVIYDQEDRTPSPSPSQQLRLESELASPGSSPLARKSAEKMARNSALQVQSPASATREKARRAMPSSPEREGPQSTPRRRRSTASSSRPKDSSRSPESAAAMEEGDRFEDKIDRLVSLGLDAADVIRAYKSTNMDKHLTGMVLEVLCRHEPIPDHPGVWTTTDDAALRYIQEHILSRAPAELSNGERERRSRMVKQRARLVAKHGEEALEERRQFLQDWIVPQGYEDAAKSAEGRRG